jgi:hypothetical protein
MEGTDWDAYGRASGNAKCANCMVHCGYEPAAVEATFGSLGGLLATARLALFGAPRGSGEALADAGTDAPPAPPAGGFPTLPILEQVA